MPLGMSNETKHWYTFGDTVVESINLPRGSCARLLCVAIKRFRSDMFPTASLLVYRYSPDPSRRPDHLIDEDAHLDDVHSTVHEPLFLQVEIEKTRVWYFMAKNGCLISKPSSGPFQSWLPAYHNLDDLCQQIAVENPAILKSTNHVIVYRHQSDIHSPLSLDTIVFELGQDEINALYIEITDESRESPHHDTHDSDDTRELELSDLIEQLEWELNGLYTFKSAANGFANMMDILLAKEGLEGVDWEVIRANRTGERRLGIDGPRYMVLEGSPLTRLSLDEVFTRNEWEVISLATWLLRGGKKEERERRLTPELVEVVAKLLNKDLWH